MGLNKGQTNKTSFVKGMTPWNKGIKGTHFSQKTEFKKGEKRSPEFIAKNVASRAGYKHSEETKRKIGLAGKGKPNPWLSERNRINNSQKRGENHYKWIKDRTKLQKYGDANRDRRSGAYNYWRKEVWTRDTWKCKIDNKDCIGRIEAHHILGWTKYPELRYEVNNGITLCHFHHPRKREDEIRLSPYFKELITTK